MRVKKVIPFSKYRYWSYGISIAMLIAVWAGTIAQGGFNLGIDFKPGLSQTIQLTASDVSIEKVRAALAGSDHNFTVQPVGAVAEKKFQIRAVANADEGKVQNLQEVISEKAKSSLEASFGAGTITVLQSEFIGPILSNELVYQTIWIALAAVLVILLYIWFRFKFAYAIAAIIALIHDPLFILGLVGTIQMEFTTATIAVVLTIIGYSLNDTIVVFDRIREVKGKSPNLTEKMINASVTQTLSRTLLTSSTTIIAILLMYIWGGEGIHGFAFCLLIGILVGTYSSIFVAAPILLWLSKREQAARAASKVS